MVEIVGCLQTETIYCTWCKGSPSSFAILFVWSSTVMLTSRKNRINRGHVKSIAHCTKLRRHFTTEWHRAKLKFFSSTVAVVIGRHQYIFMAYYNTYFHQSKIYLSCFRRDGKIRGSINSSVTITNEIILIWHHPRRRSPSPAKRATR